MIARRLLLVCLVVTVGIAALHDAGGKDLPPGAMSSSAAQGPPLRPRFRKNGWKPIRSGVPKS